ncbi:hypothetical protein [Virgibacillus necropolis]
MITLIALVITLINEK